MARFGPYLNKSKLTLSQNHEHEKSISNRELMHQRTAHLIIDALAITIK